jgi:hypothetical protein
MSNESIDSDDVVSYDEIRDAPDRDRDGVGALHDSEAEAGDEEELADEFDLDETAAREVGSNFDRLGGETPRLD